MYQYLATETKMLPREKVGEFLKAWIDSVRSPRKIELEPDNGKYKVTLTREEDGVTY